MNEAWIEIERQRTIENCLKQTIEHCERAIDTMLSSLADAHRLIDRLKEQQGTPEGQLEISDLPRRVMHALAWGSANATTSIENALSSAAEWHAATSRSRWYIRERTDG